MHLKFHAGKLLSFWSKQNFFVTIWAVNFENNWQKWLFLMQFWKFRKVVEKKLLHTCWAQLSLLSIKIILLTKKNCSTVQADRAQRFHCIKTHVGWVKWSIELFQAVARGNLNHPWGVAWSLHNLISESASAVLTWVKQR